MKIFSFKKITILGLLLAVGSWTKIVKAAPVVNLEIKHFQNTTRTVVAEVYPGHGVNLVFTKLEMTAQVVWLDDQSRIGISFDGVLCEKSADLACTSSGGGANVVHISLHKDIFSICHLYPEDPEPQRKLREFECGDLKEHTPTRSTSLSILLKGNGGSEFIVLDLKPQLNKDIPSDRTHTIFVIPNSEPIPPAIVPINSQQILDDRWMRRSSPT